MMAFCIMSGEGNFPVPTKRREELAASDIQIIVHDISKVV